MRRRKGYGILYILKSKPMKDYPNNSAIYKIGKTVVSAESRRKYYSKRYGVDFDIYFEKDFVKNVNKIENDFHWFLRSHNKYILNFNGHVCLEMFFDCEKEIKCFLEKNNLFSEK